MKNLTFLENFTFQTEENIEPLLMTGWISTGRKSYKKKLFKGKGSKGRVKAKGFKSQPIILPKISIYSIPHHIMNKLGKHGKNSRDIFPCIYGTVFDPTTGPIKGVRLILNNNNLMTCNAPSPGFRL